jgi:hypothetical protein
MIMSNAVLTVIRPGHVEIAQRGCLIQADEAVPVQLQDGQEPSHDLISSGAIGDELPERRPAQPSQPCQQYLSLLPH